MEYPKADLKKSNKPKYLPKNTQVNFNSTENFIRSVEKELQDISGSEETIDDKVKRIEGIGKLNAKLFAIAYVYIKRINYDRKKIKDRFEIYSNDQYKKYYSDTKRVTLDNFKKNLLTYFYVLTNEDIKKFGRETIEMLENSDEEFED